nr:hemicentin-1 isoform X2 [Nomia melanderi]
MGCSSGTCYLATLLVAGLLLVVLHCETSLATRLRQRSGPTDTPKSGSVNEAGVFTLRGRQEGGRRARRTTTSTTSTTPSSSTLISLSDDVAQPAALLAPEEDLWSTSSSATTNVPVSLDTAAAPSKPPFKMEVEPHKQVILPCELEGNHSRLLLPEARSYKIRPATWLHEGRPVDMITINTKTEMSGTGHRYIGDSTTASLHIDNVRLEDDGIWGCTLEDDQGKILAGRPVKLVVLDTPSFVITRLPGFGIPIVEGMSVSLKCEIDSNPASTPIWQRDNGPPVEQSDDEWLNFTKISRAESGWYKCYTKHVLGLFTSVGYFLNVRYDPDMETEAEALNGEATDSRKMEVQIGGAVTLECDGGCWGHGPGMDPVGGPGPLALSRVVYQDSGEYRCVAPDRKMQDTWRAQLPYQIKVTGRPIVNPQNQTVTAKEGEPLSIAVEFCAEPRFTKVLWISEENMYVPGAPTKDGVQALAVEDGGTESCYRTVLSFDTIQWSHAGEWLLLVRSSEGIADASVLLNVTRASGYSHAHFRSASLACLSLCLALAVLQEHRR